MAYRNTKLLFMMLMVAIGNFGEAKSGSSDSDSSSVDDDDSVTLTTCKLRGSESHSSSFDDEDTYGQCMSVYILRRSGNITMSDNRLVNAENPDGFLMSLEVISLSEVSPCGVRLISAGHSYDGFFEEIFNFSEIQDGTYRGIAVKYVTFSTILTNSANVNILLYLIVGNGNISNGDETIAVRPGIAKMSIQITNWPFCGVGDVICEHCPYYEIGNYLDFELAVKGTSAATQEYTSENSGLSFNVGMAKLIFSQMVQVDGNISSMIPGYPTYKRNNGKDVFSLRFPIFASELLYDPFFGY